MYVQIEPFNVEEIKQISVGTTATEVALNGKYCLLQNITADKDINFDIKTATANTGTILHAKTTFPIAITADKISVITATGTATLAVIYLK